MEVSGGQGLVTAQSAKFSATFRPDNPFFCNRAWDDNNHRLNIHSYQDAVRNYPMPINLKGLALIIESHKYDRAKTPFLSIKRLMWECDASRATIFRWLALLEGHGFIKRVYRTKEDGSRISSAFKITLPSCFHHSVEDYEFEIMDDEKPVFISSMRRGPSHPRDGDRLTHETHNTYKNNIFKNVVVKDRTPKNAKPKEAPQQQQLLDSEKDCLEKANAFFSLTDDVKTLFEADILKCLQAFQTKKDRLPTLKEWHFWLKHDYNLQTMDARITKYRLKIQADAEKQAELRRINEQNKNKVTLADALSETWQRLRKKIGSGYAGEFRRFLDDYHTPFKPTQEWEDGFELYVRERKGLLLPQCYV